MYDTLVYINRGSWLLLESGSLYTQLIHRAAHVHGGVFGREWANEKAVRISLCLTLAILLSLLMHALRICMLFITCEFSVVY